MKRLLFMLGALLVAVSASAQDSRRIGDLVGATDSSNQLKVNNSANTQPVNVSQINGATPTPEVTTDCDTGAGTQTCAGFPVLFPVSGGTTTTFGAWLGDPCMRNAKSYGTISLASTTATELIAGTASKKTYICSIQLVTATAQNIGIWSGTTSSTACDTGKGAMFGGTTAATGWNFGANGGIVLGTGFTAIAVSGANADKVCLTSSSTGQISGNFSYVVE